MYLYIVLVVLKNPGQKMALEVSLTLSPILRNWKCFQKPILHSQMESFRNYLMYVISFDFSFTYLSCFAFTNLNVKFMKMKIQGSCEELVILRDRFSDSGTVPFFSLVFLFLFFLLCGISRAFSNSRITCCGENLLFWCVDDLHQPSLKIVAIFFLFKNQYLNLLTTY